jgi:hypothetical protein
MAAPESVGHEVVKGAERFVGHVLAIVAGVILMVVGIALGVTIVMLPVGIPVGFIGLLAFLWGLFGSREQPPVNQVDSGEPRATA